MTDEPRKGSLLVIFLTVFIDLLGFGLVLPLLPVYAEHYLADPETAGMQLGLLMASFSAMQFIFAPFWGKLSDRFGRRPIIMVGLAGSVVFYTLFGLAIYIYISMQTYFVYYKIVSKPKTNDLINILYIVHYILVSVVLKTKKND